ncbi:uncharacterized protein B0J16DRAFT_412514 [Fusarium flagelliforme]|uniref:Short chain type dehydrogenase n=1 Tax=Fusarium flagelliforme TaxID=2675880 RepID=A0A395MBI3_9HYPO|nr:uncharacterized protein B0J16DRAFT_412514 [Fusarium flagelliforme]KAH7193989.1 hypothetical protein B0J16DRAFT_412514 [Fusarium flagelliforme]RFN44643.1 short chain type dehydrogenase [Fusarium flagelliforme]
MALQGKVVLLTGASMGIGETIASSLAEQGANLILFARSEDKLAAITTKLASSNSGKFTYRAVDISDYDAVDGAVASSVEEIGEINILINNAGLALGAPAAFPDLKIQDILTMNNTNTNGTMFVTYSVLNRSMRARNSGTILTITSITGLEVPPFPGEAVYHANKASQEAFTNALRNELTGTNIRVLALRPGCVATNFHLLRVGNNEDKYQKFFEGFEPLISDDVARAALFMISQPLNTSIKALDIVPSAQRSLNGFDRTWNKRNSA